MKRNLRKAFAFILALTMVVSLLPAAKRMLIRTAAIVHPMIHLQLPTSAR